MIERRFQGNAQTVARGSAVLFFVMLLFVVGSSAWAKSNKQFDQHVAAAQQHYTEKHYDQAIDEFQAAYKVDPEPVLLLTIGRCHYLADRPKEALDFYQQALKAKLSRSEREETVASVAKATIKLQEQQQREVAAQQAEQARLAKLVAAQPPPPPPEKPIYKKGWFWGVIGGVVAAGVIAGVVTGTVPREPPVEPSPPIGGSAF